MLACSGRRTLLNAARLTVNLGCTPPESAMAPFEANRLIRAYTGRMLCWSV